jgi:S1-C subfamily serine protease
MRAPPRIFWEEAPEPGQPEVRGVKVEDIAPGSVAAAAKLQLGDIIVAINGMDTPDWSALVRTLKAHHPGDTVELTLQRGGTTQRTQAVLRPTGTPVPAGTPAPRKAAP